MEEKRNKIYKILFFVFLAVFIVSAASLIYYLLDEPQANQEVLNEFKNSSTVQQGEELVNNPINFEELQKVNSEIYAWIYIPNTNIDYPVAQSAVDDSFYLHHNIYGKYEFAGTIYTEMRNSKDFSDRNTVLYGHNMSKGYMFRQLYNFQDAEFFKNNREFYIYTPGRILTYTVYSAYQFDNRHILNSYDFSDDAVFSEYINTTKNPPFVMKNVRDDVEVTINDKIITLSTCLGDGKKYRYMVQGVLTNEQATK